MDNTQSKEFEILGQKVKFRQDLELDFNAQEVIDLFIKESKNIPNSAHLDLGQLSLLTGLKLAANQLALKQEYETKLRKLGQTASEALTLIEEVTPPAIST